MYKAMSIKDCYKGTEKLKPDSQFLAADLELKSAGLILCTILTVLDGHSFQALTRCFDQVVIGKTDCLLDKRFCDSENVTGFPGFKFYSNGLGIDRDEVAVNKSSQ